MRGGGMLVEVLLVAVVTFVVAAVVSLLWNLISSGSPGVDWGTAVRMAVIFGVILPWTHRVGGGRKDHSGS
ncbi:MAG: hypothetical protein GF355_04415 [Candidatus Eisenbacteria bacterium]|nr:hypothetical protein [Candidatus Eisenbacteria bacterium]